ncbi:hypothetical protein COUCH_19140 [Couchioplanes caeruleus]|uniref:hypothetical protein n=1 Tax=Couchioplanes caeruleus TaxID=56438 RepID=UPI0020C05094|nr:hypothetical protein [Couchioplanes caeruleus]UQU68269.1 hypothetical protein COUCH_19140 [Couchioplanes caeruleus]
MNARVPGTAARLARLIGGLLIAATVGWVTAGRRGWVLGVLAFLVYGLLMSLAALFPADLRRWSARHLVLDALVIVPLAFVALLLIPPLPWWAAALLAMGAGAVFVPVSVRRRSRLTYRPGN